MLKVSSCCGQSKILANSNASSQLNRFDHFWSCSSNVWSVEAEVGQLDEDLVGLSDLDFLSSSFFFPGGALKPGDLKVPWPATTPTTDTCAGSIMVGLRVAD